MVIVHISDCYLPRLGGIEMQVRQLAMRQASAGHEVHVITGTLGHDQVRSGVELLDGVIVHRVAMKLPLEAPVHPRTAHYVREIITDLRQRADVVAHVHAGVISPFAWSGIRACAEMKLPTLVTVHSIWGPLAQPGFKALNSLTRWSRRGVQLASVSEVAAQRIRDVVGPDVPVLVTPNGVDPRLWNVTPIPHSAREVHVVSVMRLAPRKRAMALLGILRSARRAVPSDIRLRATIIGDGPDRSRVERYVAEHDLDITLAGRLPHEGIRDVYATADIFVQPSIKESFGLAALEARTAGIPVVAREETGITEFIHQGIEGLLADSDEHMAGAIAYLATHPEERARMAQHNRTVEPQQVWPWVLETVEHAYEAARLRVTS